MAALSKEDAYAFLNSTGFGAVATVSARGAPEAAAINFAVTKDLELVFETIQTTRKCINLRNDPRVAIVCWRGDETLQYEGIADEPQETALEELLETFFAVQPEARGHRGWPGLIYVRLRPRWLRWSRYGTTFDIRELHFPG